MPLEAERDEPLVRASEQLVVTSRGAERAKREGLEDRRLFEQDRRFALDELALLKRHERVQAGGHGAHAPHVGALDRYLGQCLGRRSVCTCERHAEHRPGQVRLEPLARDSRRVSLELGRSRLVAQDEMRDPTEKEIARVSHTRCCEVRRDEIPDPSCLGRERSPVAERFRQLQLERHRVDAVMG